jgi:hypothetical protein
MVLMVRSFQPFGNLSRFQIFFGNFFPDHQYQRFTSSLAMSEQCTAQHLKNAVVCPEVDES